MSKHLSRISECRAIKKTQRCIQTSMEKIYSFQEQLIEETESLVAGFFDEVDAELLNFDAIEAICFLIIADRHVPLNTVSLENCLTLLGVHPFLLRDTVWFLKKKYKIPPQGDLLSFIRYVSPILLKKTD